MYTATLDRRDGANLGFSVQVREACLFVERLDGGLVEAWNVRSAGSHESIHLGDEIVEVSGTSGSGDALLRECQQWKLLSLTIRKALPPHKFVPKARGGKRTEQPVNTEHKSSFMSISSQSTVADSECMSLRDDDLDDSADSECDSATQVSEAEFFERPFQWTNIRHDESSDSSDEELPVTGVQPRMGAFEFTTSGSQLGFRELNLLDMVGTDGGGNLLPALPTDVDRREHAFRRRQFMMSKSSKSKFLPH